MDAATTATPNKPSGLPRPSRLPILRNRSSQIFARSSETAEETKLASTTPRTQKRSSVALFAHPSNSTGSNPNSVTASAAAALRAPVTGVSKVAPKPYTTSRPGISRQSSRANQQRVAPAPSKSAKPEDEENHDQLGPIEGFRAASRQGFRDEETFEPQEYVEPSEPTIPVERKRSRPSLSDRTIESLQNVPATPKDRRRSSFFSPVESPMGPPLRPASALSRNGSSSSRPGTSDGTFAKPAPRPASPVKRAPASAKPASKTAAGGFGFTPKLENKLRRSVSTALTSRLQDSRDPVPTSPRATSPSKRPYGGLPGGRASVRPIGASKTVAARPSKPRPALGDVFAPKENKPAEAQETNIAAGAEKATKRVTSNPTSNSSAALREQIAAAKAAARKEKAKHDSTLEVASPSAAASEQDMHADPFNQAPKDSKHILRNRIKTAWTDGRLNIAAMGLKEIPEQVMKMYDAKAMEESHVNWAEVVDLTKLIAADNELEVLDDKVFPDSTAEELAADDESQGSQFGGLELLDLHGNALQCLPLGVRRLERLTHLNLSHNKLDNSALDVVSQISSLKELKLGHNALSGNLPASLCSLPHLETLDLQANRLLGLPEALRELVSLRVLNVAGNQLTAIPMDALQQSPLVELDASSNALIGSLFPHGGVSAHKTLRTLNIANNSLAALTFSETLELPELRTLDVTNNHLTMLPPVAGWTELITITAGDNKISELPAGFTTLTKLRNVNLTGSELRLLDPEIARMESLETLILAANPLREKKYLAMSAADIKRDLLSKLQPTDHPNDGEVSDPETVITVLDAARPSSSSKWTLRQGHLLDLSNQKLSDAINDTLGSFLKTHEVHALHLSSNTLTAIPPALWLGQDLRVLDLSGNSLAADYFSADFELPALHTLNLAHCRLTTLEPLLSQLSAPALQTLNITANRLSGPVPALRKVFPELRTLFAGENQFSSVTADALRGLTTVNIASNEIAALPAEIGVLWEEGLRNLEVGGNAFRVPGWRVLEKGSEATLRWLRERIPVSGSGSGSGPVSGVWGDGEQGVW